MKKCINKTSIYADIATIVAGLTAFLALTFGYYQYAETSEGQREALAVDLYLKYVNFQREVKQSLLESGDKSDFIGTSTAVIAESLYSLQSANKQWKNTIIFMLKENKKYVFPLECETFNNDFKVFIKNNFCDINICSKNEYEPELCKKN